MAVLAFLLLLILTAVAYVIYIIHKKGINPKEIRVHSFEDAKQLLTPPANSGPLKYLDKIA